MEKYFANEMMRKKAQNCSYPFKMYTFLTAIATLLVTS